MSEDKTTLLSSFFEKLGMPSTWAAVLAGAIVGAVSAYLALTTAGCTVTYSTSDADGNSTTFSTTIDQPVQISEVK